MLVRRHLYPDPPYTEPSISRVLPGSQIILVRDIILEFQQDIVPPYSIIERTTNLQKLLPFKLSSGNHFRRNG